ncbi:MAG TPA: L,D-transpeptidase family protein [Pseudolabrys sp.]|jgi:murein L,D-transpeptidase YcbB/YkuD|nr:L,D-transpeptidase family protein [Pseudolabrys sp.]
MRHYDRVFAASVLALTAATPLSAAPRVESVLPPPPSLNGQHPMRHREAPPAPPPAPEDTAAGSVSAPQEDRVRTQEQPRQSSSAFDIRGAVDKVLGASDAQISEKLRAIVSSKQLDRSIERPADRQAIESYYAAHAYAPLWIHDGHLTARAKAVIARLKGAGDEGLAASDYPVPEFGSFNSADALAAGDVKLTKSVLDFARHMQVGRIAPTRVAVEIDYGNHAPEPSDILRKIMGADNVDAALDSFDPPHEGFRALKRKLAEMRNASLGEPEDRIADGQPIKPGAKDQRVPALRAKLGIASRKPDDILYDRNLYNAVRAVQQRHGLKPTGVVDSKTISAINGPKPGQVIETIEANMERWRWLPRDLGQTYVMVNVPDYTLKVVNDHRVVWRTKIVAGKPQTPTPLTTASMDTIIVNPSWYVPQSIIQNELLPAYQTDPKIFDRMGLEVKKGPDGNIQVVQPPGAANALGRIKFNFSNRFQVYLHDTPEKNLFRFDRRAFSHGCMRVEDPTMFGQIILHLAMNAPTPDSRQIYAMFGHEEKIFRLQHQPKVHLTYQTAFVDDAGKLQVRDDIYGMDARIHAILHSDERKIADVPPPPDPKRDLETAKSNQEILRRVERREAHNPFHFFEQLFR